MLIPKFRALKTLAPFPNFTFYDQDLPKYIKWIDRFDPETHLFVAVEKITVEKARSIKQNSYYWGVVIKILSTDIGYSPKEMHEALKWQFLSYENVAGLRTCMSTTDLSTIEFELFLEQIRRWASMFHGIVIPEPNQVKFT